MQPVLNSLLHTPIHGARARATIQTLDPNPNPKPYPDPLPRPTGPAARFTADNPS